jgi:arylsulfatase A-like enzyme
VRNRLPTFAGVAAGLVLALGIGLNLAFRLGPRGGVGDNVPNVLWVIWDTVRSDNLSLYDYRRPTTPNLDRLARRGVTFDYASSPAPWTLPSHASMFTGLPPNALEAGWRTPLEKGPTTVAEIARAYGYRTGGFIANRFYVSRESGLSRGFSEWADYPVFTIPEFLRSTALARAAIGSSLNPLRLFRRAIEQESEEGAVAVGTPPTRPRPTRTSTAQRLVNWFRALQNESRKWAPKVNGEFLDWVTRDDARPYFAFLNYFDAHDPYRPPAPFDTAMSLAQ